MFKYLSILFLTFQVTLSPAAIVGFNANIFNKTGVPANDFHTEICCVHDLAGSRFYTGSMDPFRTRTATPGPGAFSTDISLKWENPSSLIPGTGTQQYHIGWQFDDGGQHNNSVRYKEGSTHWTRNGDPLPGVQPLLPGFTAAGIGNNSSFTLHNDTNEQLTIHNLAFQILTNQTDLNDMIPFTLPGFSSPNLDFVIDPGISIMFNPGLMQSGEFLLAELTAFATNDPTNISDVMFQHGVPVPEPSTLLLVSLGIIGLIRYRCASIRFRR